MTEETKEICIKNFLIPITEVEGIPERLKEEVCGIFSEKEEVPGTFKGNVFVIGLPPQKCQKCDFAENYFIVISEDGKTALRLGQGCRQHGFLPRLSFSPKDLKLIVERLADSEQKKILKKLIKENIRNEPSDPSEEKHQFKTTNKPIGLKITTDEEGGGRKKRGRKKRGRESQPIEIGKELDFSESILPTDQDGHEPTAEEDEIPLPDLGPDKIPLEEPPRATFNRRSVKPKKPHLPSSNKQNKEGEEMNEEERIQKGEQVLKDIEEIAEEIKQGKRGPVKDEEGQILRGKLRRSLGLNMADALAKLGLPEDALGFKSRSYKKKEKAVSKKQERVASREEKREEFLNDLKKRIAKEEFLGFKGNEKFHYRFAELFYGEKMYHKVKELGGDPIALGLRKPSDEESNPKKRKTTERRKVARKEPRPLNLGRLNKSEWQIPGDGGEITVGGKSSLSVSLPSSVVRRHDGGDFRLLIDKTHTEGLIVKRVNQEEMTDLLRQTKSVIQDEMARKLFPVNAALDLVKKARI